MSGPYPLATLGVTIDATGISAPPFSDILASLIASYQGIYGSDVILTADTQDGQWIAVIASAINNCNAGAIAAYQSFSPTYAQGAGLSSNVKLNGIRRLIATNSTADLTIIGQAFTTIPAGIVADANGYQWALPANVQIPAGGSVVATAVCTTIGNVTAGAASITRIVNPTLGWQTASNVAAATPGAPVETDAALRARQGLSVALPSTTTLAGIVASVLNVDVVEQVTPYENETEGTDANGLPPHSISLIVEGGDATAIAQAIALKIPPGTVTYGTTSETVYDVNGVPVTINFFRPTVYNLGVQVAINPLFGFQATTTTAIANAVVAYVAGLTDGDDVYNSKISAAASLLGTPLDPTFEVTSVLLGPAGGTLAQQDIVIPFNGLAMLSASNVAVIP